ncbi:hypothetical protein IWT140_01043 [Secundilactobacillus pentosiphilus]|uniref:Bacterial Ig domain-containing protein n=1 Tax=Secundilactobacillus pentosiphilus TaxID=1714682 RepID=A0A1Z5INW3_9LACO|nr:hypothetical protein [Secundilactobacillus pentosiphilus]GAX03440.1 hypothetical protein IWT140_01043 [Secundilactobacillus pentosiphilus]
MNKSVVTIATATSFMLMGGLAQASIRKTSVKPAKLTSKSTFVKGTATKSATIRLSHNHTTYAYGKATNKGKFSLKLKHKLHNSWKYRLTVSKNGYKTTTAYLKISATKPASLKNTNSSAVTSSTAVSTASNASSANSSTNSTKTAKSTTTSSATASTPATSATSVTNANDSSADTHQTPAISPKEKADLATALKYKAKAIELGQKASNLQRQSWMVSHILRDDVHSADYYNKLDSQINDYQQKIKSLLAKSPDTTSNDYQTLNYHLTKLQDEKLQAQKDDEYPKKLNELDKSKVNVYRNKAYQLQDQMDQDTDDLSEEAVYFWALSGKIYNQYKLYLDNDWNDGPHTEPTITEKDAFNSLVTDINKKTTDQPSVIKNELLRQEKLEEQRKLEEQQRVEEQQKQQKLIEQQKLEEQQRVEEQQKQQKLIEQQKIEEQQKLQEQYDKDYASALELVNQYNQNTEKEKPLKTRANQMSNNINAFVSYDKSMLPWATEQVKDIQNALDTMKKTNSNFENTSEYQNKLTVLKQNQGYFDHYNQATLAYNLATKAIQGDFVGYKAQYEALQKKIDEIDNTNNSYADQLQQLQNKYRSTGLPDETDASKNIFNLYFSN